MFKNNREEEEEEKKDKRENLSDTETYKEENLVLFFVGDSNLQF